MSTRAYPNSATYLTRQANEPGKPGTYIHAHGGDNLRCKYCGEASGSLRAVRVYGKKTGEYAHIECLTRALAVTQ